MQDVCVSFQVMVPVDLEVLRASFSTTHPNLKHESPMAYLLKAASLPPEAVIRTAGTSVAHVDLPNTTAKLTPHCHSPVL